VIDVTCGQFKICGLAVLSASKAMRHLGVANPQQLTVLSKVLDGYCRRAAIVSNSLEREDIAIRILAYYDLGIVTEDGLTDALDG
jgi:hypothetical protein